MTVLDRTSHLLHRCRSALLRRLLSRLNVEEVLAQRRQIALIWSVEDVLHVRPYLTEDQAWQILQACDWQHDCHHGMTWETLEDIADEEFPPVEML